MNRYWIPVFSVVSLALSSCEPLKVEVTIKPKAAVAAAEAGADQASGPAGYGSLVGTITLDGAFSAKAPLVKEGDPNAKDSSVCARMEIPDESIQVNAANKGIKNVIVYLAKKPAFIKPELKDPPKEAKVFDQEGCKFLPHIFTIRVGQEMRVMSKDPISHNTHTFPVRNSPLNGAISPNDRVGVSYKYTKAENEPVQVVCDLHTWMKAYHFPVDHPYIAVTDAEGKFKIDGLPAGKHAFKVWHERGKLLETVVVEIKADAETTHDFKVGGAKLALAPIPSGRVVTLSQLRGR